MPQTVPWAVFSIFAAKLVIISSSGAQPATLYQALSSAPEQERLQRPNSNPEAVSLRPISQSEESGSTRRPLGEDADNRNLAAQQDAEEDALGKAEARLEKQRLEADRQEVLDLSARDREVRAHEQAHAAVGGQYAGAPQYQFKRGPDGVNYAVSGEVAISVSKEATPAETIRKMQIVQRAALAPAEPSPQDRRVAAQASRTMAEAQAELRAQNAEQRETQPSESDAEEVESPSGISSGDADSSSVSSPLQSRQFVQFTQVISGIENAASGLKNGSILENIA